LVVLRNEGSGETFLHSHEDDYPNSDRNQVTMYSHMDDNNWWRVIPSSRAKDYQAQDFITGARFIADKQIIRLQHAPTTNFLTIFKETKAHVTPNFLEVSSVPQFPSNSSYDGSDLWRVEFVKQSARTIIFFSFFFRTKNLIEKKNNISWGSGSTGTTPSAHDDVPLDSHPAQLRSLHQARSQPTKILGL